MGVRRQVPGSPDPLTAGPGWEMIEHVFALQGTLFGGADPDIDRAFGGLERRELDHESWVEYCPGWLRGADSAFEALCDGLAFTQRRVVMYDRIVDEPRLTWWWTPARPGPEPLPALAEARRALSVRYGRDFDSIGFNFYRDGADSVAWHADRNRLWSTDPVIAIVSVGEPRPLLLRPRGGGSSRRYELGGGDLLVMGGACQHGWEHCVPKVARAGPRISISYRHGADAPADGV